MKKTFSGSTNKQEGIVKDLLIAGADPLILNMKSQTYKEYAHEVIHQLDRQACEMLIPGYETGEFDDIDEPGGRESFLKDLIDINESVDDKGNTILHIAMSFYLTHIYPDFRRIMKLIDLKADIFRKNNTGETPHSILKKAISNFDIRVKYLEPLKNLFVTQSTQINDSSTSSNKLNKTISRITFPNWAFN